LNVQTYQNFGSCVRNMLRKTIWGTREVETYFDWVGWLNSEDVVAEHFRIHGGIYVCR